VGERGGGKLGLLLNPWLSVCKISDRLACGRKNLMNSSQNTYFIIKILTTLGVGLLASLEIE
jgi:hypothetical protein